jgi:hypothetical protein
MSVVGEEMKPRRPYISRTKLSSPDRLPGVDGRTRPGRQYRAAFHAALAEFAGAPAERVAEICRLRAIAALAQSAALSGAGTADAAIRTANAAARAGRDLQLTLRATAPAALSFHDLARLAQESVEPALEVDGEAAS